MSQTVSGAIEPLPVDLKITLKQLGMTMTLALTAVPLELISSVLRGSARKTEVFIFRLQHVGLKISRPPSQIGRYRMIKHTKRPAVDGRIRYRLLWTGIRRYKIDGINSLGSLNYKIMWIKEKPLFTHIMIDIGPPPPGF